MATIQRERLTVDISSNLKRQFRMLTILDESNMSNVVVDLIKEWVNDRKSKNLNKVTREALRDVDDNNDLSSYEDIEDMLKELDI